jgi:hypothetical protein
LASRLAGEKESVIASVGSAIASVGIVRLVRDTRLEIPEKNLAFKPFSG